MEIAIYRLDWLIIIKGIVLRPLKIYELEVIMIGLNA